MIHRPAILVALLITIGLAAAGLLTLGCMPRGDTSTSTAGPKVRVRLLAGVTQCSLLASQPSEAIVDNNGSTRRINLGVGGPILISLADDGWRLNGTVAGQGTLTITPATDGAVRVNGLTYRGQYRLISAGAGRFDVINDLDIDSYLQGVLPKELFADWQPNAYAAQAVIARTYALYEVKTQPTGRTWDLNPDERSQMYGGMSAETPKALAAVEQTRGVVVVTGPAGQEKIFKAYFSSCCGGVTSSGADVFNEPSVAALEPQYNGGTCSMSPKYSWGPITFTKLELARRIRAWGVKQQLPEAKLPGLKSIEVASMNAYGRPRKFMLTDTRGQQYLITAEQMRWAINADANGGPTIYSGFFTPVDLGDTLRLDNGHGYGHGVGACQWCMQARALAGLTFEKIVLAAYPQSKLARAY